MPAPLLQWGHGDDPLQARSEIPSAAAAIGGGRDRHGREFLSGSLLARLLVKGDVGGAMRSPKGTRGLEVFSPNWL